MGGNDAYIKPLSDEKALDSGAEFLGEIIAYGTLLVWGIYELNKLTNDTKAKEKVVNDKIASAHAQIQGIHGDFSKLMLEIDNIKARLEKQELESLHEAQSKEDTKTNN